MSHVRDSVRRFPYMVCPSCQHSLERESMKICVSCAERWNEKWEKKEEEKISRFIICGRCADGKHFDHSLMTYFSWKLPHLFASTVSKGKAAVFTTEEICFEEIDEGRRQLAKWHAEMNWFREAECNSYQTGLSIESRLLREADLVAHASEKCERPLRMYRKTITDSVIRLKQLFPEEEDGEPISDTIQMEEDEDEEESKVEAVRREYEEKIRKLNDEISQLKRSKESGEQVDTVRNALASSHIAGHPTTNRQEIESPRFGSIRKSLNPFSGRESAVPQSLSSRGREYGRESEFSARTDPESAVPQSIPSRPCRDDERGGGGNMRDCSERTGRESAVPQSLSFRGREYGRESEFSDRTDRESAVPPSMPFRCSHQRRGGGHRPCSDCSKRTGRESAVPQSLSFRGREYGRESEFSDRTDRESAVPQSMPSRRCPHQDPERGGFYRPCSDCSKKTDPVRESDVPQSVPRRRCTLQGRGYRPCSDCSKSTDRESEPSVASRHRDDGGGRGFGGSYAQCSSFYTRNTEYDD